MPCVLRSLYLCVREMPRALAFYEALLEQPPAVRDDVYSVFELGGFRLGLFAFEAVHEAHRFGNSCLPSLEFPSEGALRAKLAGQQVVFALRRIGPFWVSEIEDSEGNALELTAPATPGTS